MTRTTTKRTSLIAALAAIMMMFALIPATPAQAAGAGATAGIATLSAPIPSCGQFSFSGVGGAATTDPSVSAPTVTASGNYCNTSLIAGTATGQITFGSITSTRSCALTWVRTGLVAQITLSGPGCSGTAVAAFVPLGTGPGQVQAAVVGGGVF